MPGLIVHEWIEATGGAERVVDEWATMFPDAEFACLWSDADRYPGRVVQESWLARSALRGRKAASLPYMALHWRHLDLRRYDWALVSSHSFAHHVGIAGARAGVPVYVYAHTPPRYLWAPDLDERSDSTAARLAAPVLRAVDRRGVSAKARYAVNSHFVHERAQRAWGVDAQVIYPPVEVGADPDAPLDDAERAVLAEVPQGYLVAVSRFATQKRLDLAIAFAAATDRPLVLCGRGPEEARLRQIALDRGARVQFVLSPSDALLRALIRGADAMVFPPVEDFGIVPVEAMALGCRVIVNDVGGAAESLDLVGGGVAFPFDRDWDAEAARRALDDLAALPMESAHERATAFRPERFRQEIAAWMGRHGEAAVLD